MKHPYNYLLLIFFFASCASSDNNDKDKADPITGKSASFQLATILKTHVVSDIKLPGELAAYQQVSIFPKVNAYVKTVFVDIGDKIKEGQLLMQLEAPELQQVTLRAKEKYAQSKAAFAIDKERYQRLVEASATPGAISALDLSTMKLKMDADSSLSNAEKNNWQMQSQMETYLTITAPFNGVITERNVYPGALVSSMEKDKPMLELKEISRLRLRVEIPEALASILHVKDAISFNTSAFPGKKIIGNISRKSMNIDPLLRSEMVEIDVRNEDNRLSPGMYADVIVHSTGNISALSIPASAVVTTTERKFVWLVMNGKAKKIDVTTGNESNNRIEIYGNLHEGQQVITDPGDNLSEGQRIK